MKNNLNIRLYGVLFTTYLHRYKKFGKEKLPTHKKKKIAVPQVNILNISAHVPCFILLLVILGSY